MSLILPPLGNQREKSISVVDLMWWLSLILIVPAILKPLEPKVRLGPIECVFVVIQVPEDKRQPDGGLQKYH